MEDDRSRLTVLFAIGSMGCGGAEQQTIEILKRLDRKQFRPLLYLQHRRGQFLSDVPSDVSVKSLWTEWTWKFRAKWHLWRGDFDEARAADLADVIRRERVDLVFNQTYLMTLDAAAACRSAQVPRISVCVGDPLEDLRTYSPLPQQQAISLANKAYASASRVVAVSQGLRRRLIEDVGLPPDLVEVQYNLIDVGEVLQRAECPFPALVAKRFSSNRFRILTVARLSSEKGHGVFLEALQRLVYRHGQRDLMWHIVGTGPLTSKIQAAAEAAGLSQHICFEGFQHNPFPYYRNCHLLCHPALFEAFGCVLTEAMACGLPVLATDCPSGPREVLRGGEYGQLVPPDDPEALVQAVLDFRDNTEQWRHSASLARKYVEQTFGADRIVPRLEDLMKQVVNSANAQNPRSTE